jgi:trimethylamine---corrinoid protein Co-methyltransferase
MAMQSPKTDLGKQSAEPLIAAGQAVLRRPQLRILSEDQLKELHWATLEVLEHTGVYLDHGEAREILRGAGARVEGEKVYIPAFLVENALRTAPSNVTIYRRTGEPLAYLGGNRVYFATMNEAAWILDPYTRQRRRFTSQDYRMTVRLAEASPYIAGMSGGGHASDFPAQHRAKVNFKHSTAHTSKCILISATEAGSLKEIIEMAAIVAGGEEQLRARPFIIPKAEPTAPLTHVQDAVDMLLMTARAGLPVTYYSMSAAGSTAPCSDAGALVIANADVLSGLTIHQLVRPGAPFIYGLMPGVMDMSATIWAYASPDFFLLSAAATELGHYYHLPVYGTGGCSDAKDLDMQCAAEAALGCLIAAQSGANLVHNVGMLDSGVAVSPALMVLTDELLGMTSHMVRGVEVNPQEVQLDLIHQVGPRGEFLTADHTYDNFKRFWYPKVFEHRRYDVWQLAGAPSQLDRLQERTRKLIETTEAKPLPADVVRELDGRETHWR